MYYLLLKSLQNDYIKENEIFQGLVQLRLFWNYFGDNRLARIGHEESYPQIVLLTRNIISHNIT